LATRLGCKEKISRVHLQDFFSLTLKSATDKAKPVELRGATNKLQANLITSQ
jgi:hypothetical protein